MAYCTVSSHSCVVLKVNKKCSVVWLHSGHSLWQCKHCCDGLKHTDTQAEVLPLLLTWQQEATLESVCVLELRRPASSAAALVGWESGLVWAVDWRNVALWSAKERRVWCHFFSATPPKQNKTNKKSPARNICWDLCYQIYHILFLQLCFRLGSVLILMHASFSVWADFW